MEVSIRANLELGKIVLAKNKTMINRIHYKTLMVLSYHVIYNIHMYNIIQNMNLNKMSY